MLRYRPVHLMWLLVMALISVPVSAGDDGEGGHRNCERDRIAELAFVEAGASGSTTFCANHNGFKAHMKINGLASGNAYTVWWVYIDDPDTCVGGFPDVGRCGFADFAGEKPPVIFGRMDSGVAPRRGTLHFYGNIPGMQPSAGAEVWLLAFGHGPADYSDGDRLARQLLTPEDPNAGAPHLGNFVDGGLGYPVAVTVFAID